MAPTKSTYTVILEQLAHIINESGGLVEQDENNVNTQVLKDEDDDIEIPASEFADEQNEITKSEPGKTVVSEELSIALPKDKSAPYDNNWIEVDDATLSGITFADYDILAFKHVDDADFQVIEAAYEEQE